MSKDRKWHVEFDIATGFDLNGAIVWTNPGFKLLGTGERIVYAPAENLKITEVKPPVEEGYYFSTITNTLYRLHDGKVNYRNNDNWLKSPLNQDGLRDKLYLGPVQEDDK